MGQASSAKQLLTNYNKEQYETFIITNDSELVLPVVSSVPGIGASKRYDRYNQIISHSDTPQHIKFITKNNQPHGFVWQTTVANLKQGVRWGIINTHSITSKVVSALGQYRIVAHERIAKGMISNTQRMKLKMLDLYQDRFEALEDLESLVNSDKSISEYEVVLQNYLEKLQTLQTNCAAYFPDYEKLPQLHQDLQNKIKTDLQNDITRTQAYIASLTVKNDLRSFNRARGTHSILEFVKQQMVYGLYEFQGLNQDITYNGERDFALTRGEMNDFIEDARKIIDDNQTDLRNTVTKKQHGLFGPNSEELFSYNFADDNLSTARERQVLLAVSFIEGWDKVDYNNLSVHSEFGSETLEVITATKWKNHRTLTALFKSVGYFVLNFIQSVVVPTRPWEEESWDNKDFHLYAAELRALTKANEPMWQKPVKLFKQIGYALYDVFKGIRDFGAQLSIKMPEDIINDWHSCDGLHDLTTTLTAADAEIAAVSQIEKERLETILEQCEFNKYKRVLSVPVSELAHVEYPLTAGEHNDILSSMAQGLNGFAAVFSHNLYAKDPIGGLVFTAAYAVGAGAIYLPNLTASVFGSAYVNWFTNFGYTLGSSPLAAVIGAGSTQAQAFATGWDSLINGPSGIAMDAFYKIGEDPLTIAAYLATAGFVGHLLVNGIAGHPIPWLSEFLKEDMGTVPEASEPFIGGKFLLGIYEAFIRYKHIHDHYPKLSAKLVKEAAELKNNDEYKQKAEQFILAAWLSKNAKNLQKLQSSQKFALSQLIKALFPKEQSNSLHKLLYPQAQQTIAFQIFSIPLSYIPMFLRMLSALVMAPIAWVLNKPQPLAPVNNAAQCLFNKIAKDLSRIVYFLTLSAYFFYTGLVTVPRAAVFTGIMFIGRITGIFNTNSGHALHRFVAAINTGFRTVVEWFYPTRILKSVESASPVHTIIEIDSSFKKIVEHLRHLEEDSESDSDESEYSSTNSQDPADDETEKAIEINAALVEVSSLSYTKR